jgi:hypothetical protein
VEKRLSISDQEIARANMTLAFFDSTYTEPSASAQHKINARAFDEDELTCS